MGLAFLNGNALGATRRGRCVCTDSSLFRPASRSSETDNGTSRQSRLILLTDPEHRPLTMLPRVMFRSPTIEKWLTVHLSHRSDACLPKRRCWRSGSSACHSANTTGNPAIIRWSSGSRPLKTGLDRLIHKVFSRVIWRESSIGG